ncbi:hypothetical protein [Mesorhizobium sp. B2-6-1]|uniref:hypothetical protein n=1 Tax=Mesorhizobium sp. B2-6-1 TaxID=2589916 RepID=UPI001128EACE|nr:hypothetical protein [Mesorhizobium sp. B2-6-1]TPJ60841.1 hypothetical protein FJ443_20075 [Mesorhizobium sp. B2-6-1]
MSKDVPINVPSHISAISKQSLAVQRIVGDAQDVLRGPPSRPCTQNVPKTPENVPCPVPPLRVEAIGFGAYYCAAYRRDGAPDILLDGADGKPQRFASATAAVKAAKLALHFRPDQPAAPDVLGAKRFHEHRAAEQAALQIEALGGVVVDGRVVPVEVRRR